MNAINETEKNMAENTKSENSTNCSAASESTTVSCDTNNCESKYYTLRTAKETRESIKKRLDEYNEKYVKKTVETGRTFMKDLNADPLKKIDALIDDGTKAVKTIKADSIKKYDELKDKTKDFTEKVKNSPFKVMGDIVKDARADTTRKLEEYKENGKKMVENIEKDAEIARKDLLDAGKKALDKVAFKKTVEEKISSTIEKFPSMLNLPSKKEVEELIKGIDSVNRKVDSLTVTGQSAAA
ncbi:MAG: hypothetical protein HQK61_07430 [Desulfamplus sp.]|nr:hypothetical protein [Desulfamplus sp.]